VDAANAGDMSGEHFHWNQSRRGGSRIRGGAAGVEIASRGQGAHGTAVTSMLDLGVSSSGAQAGGSAYSQGPSISSGIQGSSGHNSGSYEQRGQSGYSSSRHYSSGDYRTTSGSRGGYDDVPDSAENYRTRTYSGNNEDYINDLGDHGR